jgi:predicted deacylase
MQASLHADELPAMLVVHHLHALLSAAEATGQLQGQVVLVPVANPIGLAQRLDHKAMGRFELGSSENFNRQFPDLAAAVAPAVQPALGPDPLANVALVRQAMGQHLHSQRPSTELQSLRLALLQLAHDADHVLDLHCDCEVVMHLYTEDACWPALAPLAQLLGSEAVLLAKGSGGRSFDECLSGPWWQLPEMLGLNGATKALPQACCSATVELRGEGDVSHALAASDARALFGFLQHVQVVAGPAPALPKARCQPTPLAGSQTLRAGQAGIVVFAAEPGERLRQGDLVAEVIDPLAQRTERVLAGVDGVLYARIRERYVCAGGELGKIAGTKPFRTGPLLGV